MLMGMLEPSEQEMKQFSPFMANSSTSITTSIDINDNDNNNNNTDNNTIISNNHQVSSSKPVELHQQQQQLSFLQHQQNQLQQHHQNQQQNVSFSMMQSSPSSSSLPGNQYMGGGNHSNKENNNSTSTGAYDLGELDQALFLYLDGQTDHERQDHHSSSSPGGVVGVEGGMRPPTLNIFPSQPMHFEPSSNKASSGVTREGGESVSSGSKRAMQQPPGIELANKITNIKHNNNISVNQNQANAEPSKSIKREGIRKGPTSSSEQEGPKTPDPKTLRRLAQNREAARKSRLRKKAYVQQLESSRIRLAQLEQELQRARAQGMFLGGGVIGGCGGGAGDHGFPIGVANISSDATMFDIEYTRWLEENHRLTCELRAAVQEHVPENELKMFVDNWLAHYDVVVNLKSMVAKTDVFHLVSGAWKTPAERCFMWLGGFRPSELIKIILQQIEPLTEQQLMSICGLQQTMNEAEEALSRGLDVLNQSLSDVIASDSLAEPPNMTNYMGQMALAMNKLSTTENFVQQADSLRHQTFHRLRQTLTTRQAARCFLAISEYFHRLRALSSLWIARPRQE